MPSCIVCGDRADTTLEDRNGKKYPICKKHLRGKMGEQIEEMIRAYMRAKLLMRTTTHR